MGDLEVIGRVPNPHGLPSRGGGVWLVAKPCVRLDQFVVARLHGANDYRADAISLTPRPRRAVWLTGVGTTPSGGYPLDQSGPDLLRRFSAGTGVHSPALSGSARLRKGRDTETTAGGLWRQRGAQHRRNTPRRGRRFVAHRLPFTGAIPPEVGYCSWCG